MQTIEEVKGHCKFVADRIAGAVVEGADLGAKFLLPLLMIGQAKIEALASF